LPARAQVARAAAGHRGQPARDVWNRESGLRIGSESRNR
jgi:hypothetical protein